MYIFIEIENVPNFRRDFECQISSDVTTLRCIQSYPEKSTPVWPLTVFTYPERDPEINGFFYVQKSIYTYIGIEGYYFSGVKTPQLSFEMRKKCIRLRTIVRDISEKNHYRLL